MESTMKIEAIQEATEEDERMNEIRSEGEDEKKKEKTENRVQTTETSSSTLATPAQRQQLWEKWLKEEEKTRWDLYWRVAKVVHEREATRDCNKWIELEEELKVRNELTEGTHQTTNSPHLYTDLHPPLLELPRS